MNFFHRLWIWCKRFRHRCGYGVHSPSDFFLITSVIYESSPYYSYKTLRATKFSANLPHYRRKVNRLLFRLVNYFRPKTFLEVGTGNGEALAYMQAGCRTMDAFSIEGRQNPEETLRMLKGCLSAMQIIDCLHIAHTPFYKEVFKEALPYAGEKSCFIIGGIYESKEKNDWWQEVKANESTCITMDLYDIGLVFFDKARYKQHYIVNFL